MLYCISCKRKEVFTLEKLGTITVSVFKGEDNNTNFHIETDNDTVLPVSYVIEDTLKLYQTDFLVGLFLFIYFYTYFSYFLDFLFI